MFIFTSVLFAPPLLLHVYVWLYQTVSPLTKSYSINWQISRLEAPQVGDKQTGRFGYKYYTSWVSLESQSAEDHFHFLVQNCE